MEKTYFLLFFLAGCANCISSALIRGDLIALSYPLQSTGAVIDNSGDRPNITEMHIKSDVTHRFARTVVISKVKNSARVAKETTFWAMLPGEAYISGFIMQIAGRNYTARVEEKDKAQQTYNNAVSSGQGAAHVAINARDSNKFEVSMNIEANSEAVFYLFYEELLKRSDGHYELVININPKQIVNKMLVEVTIEEGKKLINVHTPQMRTGNAIVNESKDLDTRATITRQGDFKAYVVFHPDAAGQKRIAQGLGSAEKDGISGQFVVCYDVERSMNGGEILVKDGYFVHFFASENHNELRKHVVFVLDTSGSMSGRRLEQLKESMGKILSDVHPQDFFNVVEFNTDVKVHNLDAPSESTILRNHGILEDNYFPPAYPVNANTKTKANTLVNGMTATGMTNIYDALRVGLYLIRLRKMRVQDEKVQPIVFFLTDGDPTQGVTNTNEIITRITSQNVDNVPIISLSFGQGVNRNFLEKLSLLNYGFARHIYEDSDSSLQLQRFYKEVSSVIYRNIQFKYVADETSLTLTRFPIFFRGSEFVVAGKVPNDKFAKTPVIECIGIGGPLILYPTVAKSVSQLERLWAYMTIKKLMEDKKIDETKAKEYDDKAIVLAKKYHFVTPVTSLVVVKPNSTSAIEPVKADGSSGNFNFNQPALSSFPVNQISKTASIGGGISNSIASLSKFPGSSVISTRPIQVQSNPQIPAGAAVKPTPIPTPPGTGVLPNEYKPFLAWIVPFLRGDGTLSFFRDNYTLGYNATSPAKQSCTSLMGIEGRCTLVKDCQKLHSVLRDEFSFKQNLCVIENRFAGVCCV